MTLRRIISASVLLLLFAFLVSLLLRRGSASNTSAKTTRNGNEDSAVLSGSDEPPSQKQLSRVASRQREQSLAGLKTKLDALERSRITKRTSATIQVNLPEEVKKEYGLPDDQKTSPLDERFIVVRAPDEAEQEEIEKLVVATFEKPQFARDETTAQKRSDLMKRYLSYSKDYKLLVETKLQISPNPRTRALRCYNTEKVTANDLGGEGAPLRPDDFTNDTEYNQWGADRYAPLFDGQ